MNKIFYLALLLLFSCVPPQQEHQTTNSNNLTVVDDLDKQLPPYLGAITVLTIDSCEYFVWRGYRGEIGLTHKGNCKFCLKRK